MRYLIILAACGLLCGCEAIRERVREHDARIMAEDNAKCQSFGSQPGTDTYVQCMVGLAQVRATMEAGQRAAGAAEEASRRANEAARYNNTPSTQAGVDRTGRGCLGQTVQTPYGPQFNCY